MLNSIVFFRALTHTWHWPQLPSESKYSYYDVCGGQIERKPTHPSLNVSWQWKTPGTGPKGH